MKDSLALIPPINPTRCEDLLPGLGFEEGELEMFFDMNQVIMNQVIVNQLVERYLQTARSAPYNLNWQTDDDACIADYMLGVFKDNGVEFTKHDIVKDVFESFSRQQAGRKKKSRRSTKKRINKKKRSTRRKHRRSKK